MKSTSTLHITLASLVLMNLCLANNVMADAETKPTNRIPLTAKTLDQLPNVTNKNGITEAIAVQQDSNEIILAGENSPMPEKITTPIKPENTDVKLAEK